MASTVRSRNHHYVPRLYLKGFCRADGAFDVYDKQFNAFRRRTQYPSTAFFEKDRNTVSLRGAESDEIEKLYSGIESGLGNLFNFIRSGVLSDNVLQPDGVHLLKLHMAVQFWRLPRMDSFSDRFLLSRTPADLERLCAVARPIMPRQKVYDLIQSDSGFRHYFRSFWLPLSTFDLSKQIPSGMYWRILDVEDPTSWSNHLCSDNPFVLLEPETLLAFSGPFVFPLSGSRLLISRPVSNASTSFSPLLSVKLSILLYLQASRYVAGMNRPYMEKIIDFSRGYEGLEGRQRLEAEILQFLQ